MFTQCFSERALQRAVKVNFQTSTGTTIAMAAKQKGAEPFKALKGPGRGV